MDFADGILAFDQEDYTNAAQLFAKAAQENPRDGTTLHWLGLTYLRMGRTEEAISWLEASLKAPEPPEAGRKQVRDALKDARDALRGATLRPLEPAFTPDFTVPGEAPRWDLRLSGGAGHDSNPSLLAEDLASTLPSGRQLRGGRGDGVADLGLRAELHPFYGWRGLSLGLAATADRSVYRDLGDLDLTLASGLVQLAWGGDPDGFLAGPLGYTRVPHGDGPFALLLQAGGADARLGGDPFLRWAEGALALLVRESPRTATRVDLSTVDRSFSHDPAGALRQSGREGSLRVSQILFFDRRDRYLRLGLVTGDREAGPAFAARSTTALAEAALPLPLSRQLTLFVTGERREERFTHSVSNPLLGPKRADVTWRLTVAAVVRLTDRLHWTLRGTYSRRGSNVAAASPLDQPLFDYRRTVLSTGFDWFL